MTTTISLADVQRLPPGSCPRVSCLTYDAPAHLLPNGLPRMTLLVADVQLVIGSEFIVTARIVRRGPGQPSSCLQIERRAWDTASGRSVLMPPLHTEPYPRRL